MIPDEWIGQLKNRLLSLSVFRHHLGQAGGIHMDPTLGRRHDSYTQNCGKQQSNRLFCLVDAQTVMPKEKHPGGSLLCGYTGTHSEGCGMQLGD